MKQPKTIPWWHHATDMSTDPAKQKPVKVSRLSDPCPRCGRCLAKPGQLCSTCYKRERRDTRLAADPTLCAKCTIRKRDDHRLTCAHCRDRDATSRKRAKK